MKLLGANVVRWDERFPRSSPALPGRVVTSRCREWIMKNLLKIAWVKVPAMFAPEWKLHEKFSAPDSMNPI